MPRDVARLIRRGNQARDRGAWQDAIAAYAAAMEKAPGLAHIRVQLGHARKESGEIEAAHADYAKAAELAPDDPDPRIHLGIAAKLLGQRDAAHRHYMAALERAPGELSLIVDALHTAPAEGPGRDESLARIAATLGMQAQPATVARDAAVSHAVCTDITDLLAYFGRARLPTGIQRVQIEIVMAIGTSRPDLVTICCYSPQRRGWSAVDVQQFLTLARMSLASDDRSDPAWRREVVSFHVALARAPLLRFGMGAVLLNLGTSWSERNYLLHVRAAREESGVAYIPIVYDCIPMFAPHWFPTALVRDYRAWMAGLLDAADGVIAISQATRADLLRIAFGDSDRAVPDAVRVVPMDGDFRRGTQTSGETRRLGIWGLAPESYVLMVSTLEPRKNHVGAFQAWLDLIARHGPQRTPVLVCVGGKGWLNEPVHAMLRRHPALRAKVMLLSGVADADLDLLYRCALFTLYPSFYEGWGLPVTESLCHGRVPAISRGSSLPEAGGSFAVYFDPHDPVAIADAVTPLLFDDGFRHRREQHIRADFRPRAWSEIAVSLTKEALDLGLSRPLSSPAPRAEPDILYTFGIDMPDDGPSQSGERFRAGWSWGDPNAQGNPIGPATATVRLIAPPGPWVAHLRLAGETGTTCRIATSIAEERRTIDRPGGAFWAIVPVAPDPGGLVEIRVSSDAPLLLSGLTVTRPDRPSPPVSDSTAA